MLYIVYLLYAAIVNALGRFMVSDAVLPNLSVTLISRVEVADDAFTLKIWVLTVDARKLEFGLALALYLIASYAARWRGSLTLTTSWLSLVPFSVTSIFHDGS